MISEGKSATQCLRDIDTHRLPGQQVSGRQGRSSRGAAHVREVAGAAKRAGFVGAQDCEAVIRALEQGKLVASAAQRSTVAVAGHIDAIASYCEGTAVTITLHRDTAICSID